VNNTPNPILSIDLSDGATFKFDNFDDVSAWLEKEQAAFSWLIDGGAQAGAGVTNLRQAFVKFRNVLRQKFDQWKSAPDNDSFKQQFADAFRNAYSAETSVRSDHEFARIAADIAAKDGSVAGAAAFGALLGVESELSFNAVKGIIGASLKKAGIDPKSPDLVSKTIADLNSSASTDRARSTAEWSGITEEARTLLGATRKSFDAQFTELDTRNSEMVARVNESVNASIKSIENTESAYKEQMKLQASVEYWNAKAAVHRDAIKLSRLTLILFTAVGGALLVAALFWIAATAVDLAGKSTGDAAIYLKFAAIGAIVTTITFWIGRVLLRIYLSDRHLLTDAEERIAMVKTYLALTSEGKLEPTDRALVLAPLFRSAADGIVKDDGPDASLAGIIAKALDVRGGR
jgi:uncharacterized protein DUF6161